MSEGGESPSPRGEKSFARTLAHKVDKLKRRNSITASVDNTENNNGRSSPRRTGSSLTLSAMGISKTKKYKTESKGSKTHRQAAVSVHDLQSSLKRLTTVPKQEDESDVESPQEHSAPLRTKSISSLNLSSSVDLSYSPISSPMSARKASISPSSSTAFESVGETPSSSFLEADEKPTLPPRPTLRSNNVPSSKPLLPPKPIIELSSEDIERLIDSIKKFSNSIKQLLAVAKGNCLRAENIQTTKSEILVAQIKVALDDLQEVFANFSEEVRLVTNSKDLQDVKKLYDDLPQILTLASVLINGMKQLSKEANDYYVQTLKSLSTARDYVNTMIETVTKYSYHVNELLPTQLTKFSETCANVISSLLGTKITRLITFGKRLEIEAASRAVITSIFKLISCFHGTIGEQLLTDTKVASSTISQLVATLNHTVNSNPQFLCVPSIKQSISDYGANLKTLFNFMIEQTKFEISNFSEESYEMMLESVEPIRSAIREMMASILCIAEIESAEADSITIIPTRENFERANKIVAIPEGSTFTSEEWSLQSAGGFDYPSDYIPDTENIWDEPEDSPDRVIFGENNAVKCATLNKLVCLITSSTAQDMNLTKTFTTTFRSFTTPELLLKKLSQRYRVPDDFPEPALPIQLRVCNALKFWVESQAKEFTGDLRYQLEEFLCELDQSKSYSKFATSIRATLEKVKEDEQNTQNEIINLTNVESKIPLSPSTILFVFDEEEIARQLTLVDFRIYKSIKPEELLNQAWSKPKYKHRAKNVLALIARSTALTKWVASVILWQETLKGRIRALIKMITLAEHLRKLNNFNSVMAIISGINTSAIFRLKFTKNGVPPQILESFEKLQEMMNPRQSYANYRQILRSSDPPLVPFLGTYLTDITFIEDGNPDYLKGLINFRKREFGYNVLRELQQYQLIGYSFALVDNIAHYLTELPIIDNENDLYELSLLREPKNATLESIE